MLESMGDLMNIKPPEDELDLAAEEFEEAYKNPDNH